jgi:hypothetical protein
MATSYKVSLDTSVPLQSTEGWLERETINFDAHTIRKLLSYKHSSDTISPHSPAKKLPEHIVNRAFWLDYGKVVVQTSQEAMKKREKRMFIPFMIVYEQRD